MSTLFFLLNKVLTLTDKGGKKYITNKKKKIKKKKTEWLNYGFCSRYLFNLQYNNSSNMGFMDEFCICALIVVRPQSWIFFFPPKELCEVIFWKKILVGLAFEGWCQLYFWACFPTKLSLSRFAAPEFGRAMDFNTRWCSSKFLHCASDWRY